MSQNTKLKTSQRKAIEATHKGQYTLLTAEEVDKLTKRREPTLVELALAKEIAQKGSDYMARR